MRHSLAAALGFAGALAHSVLAQPGPASLTAQDGSMAFTYSYRAGGELSWEGVPIFRGTDLFVRPAQGGGRHYLPMDQMNVIRDASVEAVEEGRRVTLHHFLPPERECPFAGEESFTVSQDGRYVARVEFTLADDATADIEWIVGALSPIPLSGAVATVDGDEPIVLPDESAGWEGGGNVARSFDRLEIASRMGPIVITSSPEGLATFFDFRRQRWAVSGPRSFYLGMRLNPVEGGAHRTCEVTISLPPVSAGEITRVSREVNLSEAENARVPHWDPGFIVPTPKEMVFTEDSLRLTGETRVHVGADPGEVAQCAGHRLVEELSAMTGLDLACVPEAPPEGAENVIILAASPEAMGLALPPDPEGYAISVDSSRAIVAGSSEAGLLNGVWTLIQTLRVDADGPSLRGVEITDWPSLRFRGVHALTGRDAGGQIAHAVRRLWARQKINALVWECEYLIWDHAPELEHDAYGMTKEDAQHVIREARACNLEIIPLLQTLGHCEWMFTRDQHLDLAEDPITPYAYSPTNPATYEFIFPILEEVIDLFDPRMIHIGHDEVNMRGRFPFRSEGRTKHELVIEDTRRLRDWLAERGIGTMLWGDMFLHSSEGTDACLASSLEEARAMRSDLPRDVTIADWHYAPAEPADYRTLSVWRSEEIAAVGAGWLNPDNIRNLARAAVDTGSLGYLQTTWAGFNFRIDGAEGDWLQYVAHLLAAQYAWTGEPTPVDELPFDPEDLFLDLWFERRPSREARDGFTLDLRPLCNRTLADGRTRGGWMGLGDQADLSTFPMDQERFGEVVFRPAANEDGAAAILTRGLMNPPGDWPAEVRMTLEPRPVEELHFLMCASARAADGRHAGDVAITRSDGSSQTVPLVYGENLFAFNDVRMSRSTWLAWRGESELGRVGLWDVVLRNERPEAPVTAITVSSAGSEAAPVVLAVTGLVPQED